MSIILKQNVFIFRLKTLFEITYCIPADGIFRHWAQARAELSDGTFGHWAVKRLKPLIIVPVRRLLIKLSQGAADPARRAVLNEVACTLFFHLTVQVCEESNFYPPTKQFFASCVEILGQVGQRGVQWCPLHWSWWGGLW